MHRQSVKGCVVQLRIVRSDQLKAVSEQITGFKPNFIYISAGTQDAGETAELHPFSLETGSSGAHQVLRTSQLPQNLLTTAKAFHCGVHKLDIPQAPVAVNWCEMEG